ncbi:MAG TPA: glycerophosphodiester phosphodiesterase [Acidimicrobiia bacterium]
MPPITFAHRGARAHQPENTLAAFRHALEAGVDGLETDAWTAGDGEVVLVHDPVVTVRRAGVVRRRLRVPVTPSDELARHDVPRLAELYGRLGADYELSIDLKDESVGARVLDVARADGDPGRLWLCSPSRRALRALRELAGDVRLVHSTSRHRIRDSVERHAADLAAHGIDAMNLHHSEWTRGLVELFHRFEVRAFAWDTQEVRHIRAMLDAGIDGLYSDHVDRLVSTVAEWSAGR